MTTKTVTIYDRASSLSAGNPLKFSPDQFSLIKAQCCKGLTDDEFLFFAQFATSKGLNPLAKEIYCWNQSGKLLFVTAIDGLRKVAGQSGRYNGRTAPEWMDDAGVWHTAWIGPKRPVACRVGVRMAGVPEPTYATVMMSEFGKDSPTWKAMPAHMLAKVAESHALRAAFPDQLSGLHEEGEASDAPPYSPGTKKVTNVSAMLDEVAPDIIEQAPTESLEDWAKLTDSIAEASGWAPDEYEEMRREAFALKKVSPWTSATPTQRKEFEDALNSGKLRQWWQKKTAKA